jgi:protein-arginine kinase activator protein McsA
MPRSCPECKSANTRQMDKESFGDTAYCLSCYNRFRSVVRVDVKSIKPIDRSLERMRERIERIEKSIKEIKKELEEL